MSSKTITIKGVGFDAVTGERVAQAAKHTVKPSATLMRTAVKKPSAKTLQVQTALEDSVPEFKVEKKKSVSTISHAREKRAEQTIRSERVSRFARGEVTETLITRVAHVPVQVRPDTPNNTEPEAPEPKRTNDPTDLFMNAIASATHYVDIKEHARKQRKAARRHVASMATGAFALLIVVGFAVYINSPSIQVQVAGLRAGVHAASTNFGEAGFAYTGVQTTTGTRTIGLSSNGGGKYQLIERSTNWDSQTMIDSVSSVEADGTPNYTTLQVGHDTIYRFSDNQATWVKAGTWYHLSGNAPVTDTQLKSLVANS